MKVVSENRMSSTVKSISYNIILQILMRVVSFVSNATILRTISSDMFGVINVRLMLLYSTVRCLSGETFRRSCLNQFDSSNARKTLNLLWLSCPNSIVIGLIFRFVWLHLLKTPNPDIIQHYDAGVNTTVLCVFIEMLAEPVYVLAQSYNFIKLKVVIEGVSVISRSFGMMVLLLMWPDLGIQAFCLSQILSSVIYTVLYYGYFAYIFKSAQSSGLPISSVFDILPKRDQSREFVDSRLVILTWSMYKQTILKQILTEGERYIMTFFNVLSFSEQGIYDVVSNLGSLAARLIFLPIEETGYRLFTQLLERGKPAHQTKNSKFAIIVLQYTVKVMLLLGLVIVTFGFSYSKLLLLLYGGRDLSSSIAHSLLRWQCIYILFLALNGITECFVFSARNATEIDKYNRMMVLYSITFIIMSIVLTTYFGSKGFVIANCTNMGLRITNSLRFILEYLGETLFGLQKAWLPHLVVLTTLGLCFIATSTSEAILCCALLYQTIVHFAVGIVCFVALMGVIALYEQGLVEFFKKEMYQLEKKCFDAQKKKS